MFKLLVQLKGDLAKRAFCVLNKLHKLILLCTSRMMEAYGASIIELAM